MSKKDESEKKDINEIVNYEPIIIVTEKTDTSEVHRNTVYETASYAFAQLESLVHMALNESNPPAAIFIAEELLQVARLKLDKINDYIVNNFGEIQAIEKNKADLEDNKFIGIEFSPRLSKNIKKVLRPPR